MYTQQPQSPPYQSGYAQAGQHPAARIVQDTVMRLKDLDVRLEALNHDLAQLCDSVGNPQAAQIARTPRQSFAANIVGAQAGISPQGISPTNPAATHVAGVPQANWSTQVPSFAPSPFNVPQSAAVSSPFQVPQSTTVPSPFNAQQATLANQVPPQFNVPAAHYANQVPPQFNVPAANFANQVPSFAPSPFNVPQANFMGQVPPQFNVPPAHLVNQVPPYAPNPFVVPQANWGTQLPNLATSPYAAVDPVALLHQSALLQSYGATGNPYTTAWNAPQNPIAAGIGFGAGIPTGAQAPFAGNMIR